jgi:hypothetical protein
MPRLSIQAIKAAGAAAFRRATYSCMQCLRPIRLSQGGMWRWSGDGLGGGGTQANCFRCPVSDGNPILILIDTMFVYMNSNIIGLIRTSHSV